MKIIFISGSHPRHLFIARRLDKLGLLSTYIIEKREKFIPDIPNGIPNNQKKLFKHHFEERDRIETKMFGKSKLPNCEVLEIEPEDLNSLKIQNFLKNESPDLLLSYGCHFLDSDTLKCVDGEKWNCHGGLSPWYKGAITHFWPSYMLEPQYTGMTVHDLTIRLDAGSIIHQCSSDLIKGDTLHMLAARSVIKLGDELPIIIKKYIKKGEVKKLSQKSNGMLWLSSKWKPHHLEMIYNIYNDKIVDRYLDGEISGEKPKLFRENYTVK